MDIFSLKATDNLLYMGCRNHNIIPMSLSQNSAFVDQVYTPI